MRLVVRDIPPHPTPIIPIRFAIKLLQILPLQVHAIPVIVLRRPAITEFVAAAGEALVVLFPEVVGAVHAEEVVESACAEVGRGVMIAAFGVRAWAAGERGETAAAVAHVHVRGENTGYNA